MAITIVSTTEKKEVASSTEGKAASENKEVDTKSASSSELDETADASDASEENDSQDESLETKDGKASDEDAEEETQVDGEKFKKKNGFKKRIDKLNKRISDRDQEVEYWKKEALKGQSSKSESPTHQEVKVEGKPLADHFDTHEAYVEALTDWKTEQKLNERETKQKETLAKSEHQKSVTQFQEKVQSFKDSHDDFDDLIEDVDDIPMSIAVEQLIIQSENGPELMYELAKNREEYERICKLSPLAAAREFGKFEARLNKSVSSKEKLEIKTTKAPKPLAPLGSKGSSVKKSLYDSDLSQTEYEQLRTQKLNAR